MSRERAESILLVESPGDSALVEGRAVEFLGKDTGDFSGGEVDMLFLVLDDLPVLLESEVGAGRSGFGRLWHAWCGLSGGCAAGGSTSNALEVGVD
jgi:hypothetical protein